MTTSTVIDGLKEQALYDYFSKWDPIGLIAQGFPNDEYDREAFELLFWYDKAPPYY